MDLLGIARSEIPYDLPGRSLAPEKLASDPLPFAVSEYLVPNLARMRRLYGDHKIERFDRALRGIRQNGYKTIFSSDGQSELYDLKADPAEAHNLAAHMPEMIKDMQVQLESWLESIGASFDMPVKREGEAVTDIDPRVVKRLQDLGYF
jgi:hypothetical protein